MATPEIKFYTALTDTLAAYCGEGVLASLVHITNDAPAPRPAAEILNWLKRVGEAPGWRLPAGEDPTPEIHAFIENLASAVNRTPAQVTAVLNAFTARESGNKPPCGKVPDCRVCRLQKMCDYGNEPLPEAAPQSPAERLRLDLPLTPGEALAVLLGGGKPRPADLETAGRIIERFGSLARVIRARYCEFAALRGVSAPQALRLAALGSLARLANESDGSLPPIMRSGGDFFHYYRPKMLGFPTEHFWVVILDQRNRILRDEEIVVGSVTGLYIVPRDVFAPAVRANAAAVAFLHNHPSGDPTPSAADEETTARLCEAAKLLGIRVLDHVIIGDETYYSFTEQGKIP